MLTTTLLGKFSKIVIALSLITVAIVIGFRNNKPIVSKEKAIVVRDTMATKSTEPFTTGDEIVQYGMQFLGTPYVSAGCSADGFDCSGFVYYVFKHFKIETPRSSGAFERFGKEIPIEQVQKGDILLFLSPTRNAIGHIGIVSNPNGKASNFIHASSGREMKVIITNLKTPGYTRRFVKAIRVL